MQFTKEIARNEFDYHDDARVVVRGNMMLGALRRWGNPARVDHFVFGSINRERSTSRACVGWTYDIGKKKILYLHRVVWIWHHGSIPDGMQVDHISGNPCDNRIENLRLTTPSQNQMNRQAARKGSRCPYIGVTVNRAGYAAFSAKDGKPIYLGHFSDPIEAAIVRDLDAKEKAPGLATLNRDLFPEVRVRA